MIINTNVCLTGYIYIYIVSVQSPFSERVGLPLHNILFTFLSVMDIFSVDLKFCLSTSTLPNHVLLGLPTGMTLNCVPTMTCRCCCFSFKTYGRNGATPILRYFNRTASSTTGGFSRWNILMCLKKYIILSSTVPVLDFKDAILFLQCLFFVHFHFL